MLSADSINEKLFTIVQRCVTVNLKDYQKAMTNKIWSHGTIIRPFSRPPSATTKIPPNPVESKSRDVVPLKRFIYRFISVWLSKLNYISEQ